MPVAWSPTATLSAVRTLSFGSLSAMVAASVVASRAPIGRTAGFARPRAGRAIGEPPSRRTASRHDPAVGRWAGADAAPSNARRTRTDAWFDLAAAARRA